jgi:hypothetical protein
VDPVQTLRRIIDAVTFRRRVFVWMQFESDATGDAIVIVALTSFVVAVAAGVEITLNGVLSRALNALVAWLIIAALTWAAARFIYNSRADYAPVLRVAGFAFPTTLLLLVTLRAFPNAFGYYVSFAWFLAVMAAGTREVMDLSREQAWGATLAGFGGWVVLQALLGGGGFF